MRKCMWERSKIPPTQKRKMNRKRDHQTRGTEREQPGFSNHSIIKIKKDVNTIWIN